MTRPWPTLPIVLLLTASALTAAGAAPSWRPLSGNWSFGADEIVQREPSRASCALDVQAAYADCTLDLEFNIAAEGPGVRAAAVVLRAAGTLSYYWLHLDSRNRQVIFTRSTPQQPWLEIARRPCPALTDGCWHALRVVLQGPQCTVLLDGSQVLQAADQVLASGYLGLGTSQGQVRFRNLKLEGTAVTAPPLRDEQPPYQVISRGEAAGSYQAFPDVCRLKNGDLMAVFYAGYGHVSLPNEQWPQGGRICSVRSSDEGRSWSAPRVLYDDADDNRDPHISQLSDGTLVCSFFSLRAAAKGYELVGVQLTCSRDGGETWEKTARNLAPGWAVSAPVRELPEGTLLLGVYAEGGGGAYGGVLRSSDHGATWSAPIPIGQEAHLPLDAETDLIRRQDGSLYAALRSSSVNMHYATSADGGLTWSQVRDIGFKAHAPHFTRLSSGEILLTHRLPATALHVSRDECRTWQGPYQLDTVGGAYPATVELKDGSVLAVYYEEGADSAVRALRFRLRPEGIEPLGQPAP